MLGSLGNICPCWFIGRTRNNKEVCYRGSRPLNEALARTAGVHIPQFDAPAIDRKEDDYCTSMLSERQCKKLTAIPRGVYNFFL